MKSYLFFLILISSNLLVGCNIKMTSPVEKPILTNPFQIARDSPFVILPDSLGRDTFSGSAILEGRIKDNSLKKEYFLMRKFTPFFEEYFATLEVDKLDDIEINRDYVLTIKVFFRPQ